MSKARTPRREELVEPAARAQGIEQRIYAVIRKIPRGRVITYGQVAMLAGAPRNSRQVARLLRYCDPKARLPWFRVLGKHGPRSARISVPEPEHATEQRSRLEREGVRFSASGTVRLDDYGWLPID